MITSIIVNKPRKNKNNPARVLQPLISHTHWGKKIDGKPKHVNTAETIIKAYNWRKDGNRPTYLERLTLEKIRAHQRGECTLYFCGAQRINDKATLAMIDIDCHKTGTLEGAKAFAKHLKETLWPDLYWEVSTNGNGVHGYLIVGKDGVGSEIVNKGLARLEGFLRLRMAGYDIELVEVKGKCPILDFHNGRLDNVKAGTLAKIPRGDFTRTTRLDYTDLLKLPLPAPAATRASATRNPENREASFAGTRKIQGSVSQSLISDTELDNLAHYRTVAADILNQATPQTTGRVKVTTEDVAIFLLLGKFFTLNPNDDGTLPQRRWKGLWSKLYADGEVTRGFDDKRFKAIRDLFSYLSLLDWQDDTYVIGGQACKWGFSTVLMGILSPTSIQENRVASFAGTENIRPVHISKVCVLNPDYPRPTLRAIALRPENWYLFWSPDNLTTEVIAA